MEHPPKLHKSTFLLHSSPTTQIKFLNSFDGSAWQHQEKTETHREEETDTQIEKPERKQRDRKSVYEQLIGLSEWRVNSIRAHTCVSKRAAEERHIIYVVVLQA